MNNNAPTRKATLTRDIWSQRRNDEGFLNVYRKGARVIVAADENPNLDFDGPRRFVYLADGSIHDVPAHWLTDIR